MSDEVIEKTIKVNDNRIIRLAEEKLSLTYMFAIKEDFLKDGEYDRSYTLGRWDDYGFRGHKHLDWKEEKETKTLSYEFDCNHPFFVYLLRLLNGEKELIIDDDDTPEDKMKYMHLHLDDDYIIRLDFVYNLNNQFDISRFNVFIKNVGFDLRSKLDCDDTDIKERLHFFFNDIYDIFFENPEYHQITTEEYLASKKELTLEESKKYVKKLNFKGDHHGFYF